MVIVVINVIRNKHIIFSVIPAFTMVSTSLVRLYIHSKVNLEDIPVEVIPMIMMAFDAEYR
jgi:hypothetical protein